MLCIGVELRVVEQWLRENQACTFMLCLAITGYAPACWLFRLGSIKKLVEMCKLLIVQALA